jgi:peptide/nickel transport system substrate-binding protein
MLRRWMVLTTVCALVVAASLLAFGVDSDRTFVLLRWEQAVSLDPAWEMTAGGEYMHGIAYEGLLKFVDGEMELEPCLATSYQVAEDGLSYTFQLREGVTFHDGTPFNAEAVKYSWDRLKALEYPVSTYIEGYSHAETNGDYEITLYLEKPNTAFIWGITWVKIISPTAARENEVDGDWGAAYYQNHMVGTGPYMLDHWDPCCEILWVRYPDYWRGWGGKHLHSIMFKVVREPSTRRLLLESGEADMDAQTLISDIPATIANPDLEFHQWPSLGIAQIMMSTSGDTPLADIQVREAMAYAFNYDQMIDGIMEGLAFPAQGPLNPAYDEHDSTIKVYEQDLAEAARLLDEAGWILPPGKDVREKDGAALKLTYTVVQNLQLEIDAGLMFQQDLASIGVELEIVEMAWATLVAGNRNCATGPDMGFLFSGGNNPDPYNSLVGPWHTGGYYDWSCMTNPELDDVIDTALATLDYDQRKVIYQEAQRMIADYVPAIWVMTNASYRAARAWVHGYKPNPADEFLTNFYTMWIE